MKKLNPRCIPHIDFGYDKNCSNESTILEHADKNIKSQTSPNC